MRIPEISLITCEDYDSHDLENLTHFKILSKDVCDKFEQRSGHDGNNEDSSITLGPGQILQGTGWRIRRPSELDFLEQILVPWMEESLGGHNEVPKNDRESEERLRDYPPLPTIQLTTRDVTRWNMAWRSVCAMKQMHEQSYALHEQNYEENFASHPAFFYRFAFSRRREDRPHSDNFDELSIILSFSAAGLIYGGLHALAWFAHFESLTERWLWRVSACVVMGGLPVIYFFVKLADEASNRYYIDIVTIIFLGSTILVYILARGYLVVECFINLFNLPAGVYEVPSWSAYFPHIS